MALRIELFEDSNHEFRWRGVEANGRIIVASGEGYISMDGAERAVNNVVGEFRGEIRQIRRQDLSHDTHAYAKGDGFVTDVTFPAVDLISDKATGG